jgi:hypothetical protein
MKILTFLLLLTLFSGCEDKFEREKYDVTLYFKNTTAETVELSVTETNHKIKWEKRIPPNETYTLHFNIKKDIESREGGFIYKAIFPGGEVIEKNTGYYTNYQIQSPRRISITKEGFEI